MSETIVTQDIDDTAIAPASLDPATGTDQNDVSTAEPQTETETPPKVKDWRDKIIAEKAFEAREAKRQNEHLAAQLRQYQQQQPTQPTPDGFVPIAEVEARAAEFATKQRFNDECNAIAAYGEVNVPGWMEAQHNFSLMGTIPEAFLEFVAEAGKEEGARIYAQLGNNPVEAHRIFSLSPARMLAQVGRMAAKPAASASVSKAPPPITPITPGSSARPNDEPDEKDNPAWTKWFNDQRRKR